jgi:hypothetical protein
VIRRGVLDPGIAFLQKPLMPSALALKALEALEVLDYLGS